MMRWSDFRQRMRVREELADRGIRPSEMKRIRREIQEARDQASACGKDPVEAADRQLKLSLGGRKPRGFSLIFAGILIGIEFVIQCFFYASALFPFANNQATYFFIVEVVNIGLLMLALIAAIATFYWRSWYDWAILALTIVFAVVSAWIWAWSSWANDWVYVLYCFPGIVLTFTRALETPGDWGGPYADAVRMERSFVPDTLVFLICLGIFIYVLVRRLRVMAEYRRGQVSSPGDEARNS